MKTKKISKKQMNFRYFVLYFLIYSFIGWLLETFYAVTTLGHFVKRGFLYGPLCPIYGWGAIILIKFLNKYKSNSLKLFFSSAIVFSIFEYIVGFCLDALFQAKWWDYTDNFMNLNGRISIFFSFAWGIIGILFINHIHPSIEKHVKMVLKKIPHAIQIILIDSTFIYVAVDTILSCLKYFNVLIL